MKPTRGQVWLADLGSFNGCEQGGARPVLIIQNDMGNFYSPTVIVAAITDGKKRYMPTHVNIKRSEGLTKNSVIMFEQIRTIDKRHLIKKLATLTPEQMIDVNQKLLISLEIRI